MAVGKYQFPQQSAPLTSGERGIASLHHPGVGTLRFRSNPNEFNWSYTLNKRVDQTYGGRVIQLLGTRIEDFTFKADSGRGGWAYANQVAIFLRNVMIEQRKGRPATFEYTTRGWKFNAYVASVPFADAVEEVLREFEIGLKVQEDVTGLISRNTLQAELRRLQADIGFHRSKYNDPRLGNNLSLATDAESDPFGINGALVAAGQVADLAQSALSPVLNQNFLPNGVGNRSLGNSINSLFEGSQ